MGRSLPAIVLLAAAACAHESARPASRAAVERREIAWEPDRPLRVWRPARADSAPLPLLVFSPGLWQSPPAYDSLLSGIAGDGFVIVGVPLPRAQYDSAFNFYGYLPRFTRDVSRALDRVLADSSVTGIDTARIGAFGHSYGGAMSAELCHRDPRFKAAANFDGSTFGLSVTRGNACPFLLFFSRLSWVTRTFGRPEFYPDRDQGHLHEEMMFERSRRMWWLSVEGLDHMAFTDRAFRTTRWQRAKEAVGWQLDAGRVQEAAARYASAFFRYTLNDGLQPEELQHSPYAFMTLRARP